MKTMIISYSRTGNNEALAASVATALGGERVRITELKSRKMGKIVWDVMSSRTPKVVMPVANTKEVDLVLFVGPVWMGQVASPFRACFKQLGPEIGKYAFISICGGADGPNPKLADELKQRLGKEPVCLLDLHIADLLPSEPEPTRDDTMAYRVTDSNVKHLTDTVVAALQEAMAS